MRLKDCMRWLTDYANGKIDKIPELEQPTLAVSEQRDFNLYPFPYGNYNYQRAVSANNL